MILASSIGWAWSKAQKLYTSCIEPTRRITNRTSLQSTITYLELQIASILWKPPGGVGLPKPDSRGSITKVTISGKFVLMRSDHHWVLATMRPWTLAILPPLKSAMELDQLTIEQVHGPGKRKDHKSEKSKIEGYNTFRATDRDPFSSQQAFFVTHI